MIKAAEWLNEKYDSQIVEVEINDQYYNMREKIEPVMHVIDIAMDAMKEAGVTPKVLGRWSPAFHHRSPI